MQPLLTWPHHKRLYNQMQAILQTGIYLKLRSLMSDTVTSEGGKDLLYPCKNSTVYAIAPLHVKMPDKKLSRLNFPAQLTMIIKSFFWNQSMNN